MAKAKYKRFTEGREDVDDDERLGAATTITSKTVKKIVLENRRTVWEIAKNVCISIDSCHTFAIKCVASRKLNHSIH